MKSNSRYFIISICVFLTDISQAQWTKQKSVTDQNLNSIYFPTNEIGYAVGGSNKSGIIIQTNDKGDHWSDAMTHSSILTDVFFVGNTGYAVGNDRDTLLKIQSVWWTAWGKQKFQGLHKWDRPFTKIFFTGDSIGYSPGYKTFDGGLNWVKQDSAINRFPHIATDIWFTNDSTGYIAGHDYWGTIYKTTNKGNSWKPVNIPSYIWEVYAVHFPTPNIGYASGLQLLKGKKTDVIIKTTDNGENWDTVATFPAQVKIILSSLRCTDNNICYAVGNRGIILKTTDGGKYWNYQPSGTLQNLNKIFFTDTKSGYIVGDSGTILKTINGGDIAGIKVPDISISVKLYPNPFDISANLVIEGNIPWQATIKLNDLAGRQILQKRIEDKNKLIEREQLPAGMYFYTISNANKLLKTGKLLVQ